MPDEEKTVAMMVECQIARGIARGDFEPFLYSDEDDEPEPDEIQPGDAPRLGKCCICEQEGPTVRNIVMLSQRSPEPGTGCWGCFQCGLPTEGAVAVVCDDCIERFQGEGIKYACLGGPAENRRIPIEQLSGDVFDHDMSKHPGEQ